MQVVHEWYVGLDAQKNRVVACRITPEQGKGWHKEVRSFGTMTDELLSLVHWLRAAGVTRITMESTGVNWKGSLKSCW